ncbi:ArdC-like ssDNA-binding domain-containing protein [Xylanimonas ulmi]|uniref:N-terminal domain-containing protein n=1 Tax=Xylanimonas ulmi TaxID=228973 RepID=A0A4Q7M1I3_9MICO|nr:ArdC-like ssDNA-binding domain-containing protein [Xylanibacterium ulmi]RZS60647.1 hypothetical protein EV386_0917 [Xylanibacterium ulmi]
MDAKQVAEREAKIEALQARLSDSVAALVTGEDWRRAIAFAGKFRSRSFANSLLIYVQSQEAFEAGRMPTPTPQFVAGYHQWLSLGRHVIKGQAGFMIFAPVTARFATSFDGDTRRLAPAEPAHTDETVESRHLRGKFRPTYVWPAELTEGDPLPLQPLPQLLVGEAPARLWDGVAEQIRDLGFEVRDVPNAAAIGGANGLTHFGERWVAVRQDMDPLARLKSLIHERAHASLHQIGDPDVPAHRGIAEVEAEAVAQMVLDAHGADSSAYTVPYVASWATSVPGRDPVQVVASTAERVRKTAVGILDHLDTFQVPSGDPPGLHRYPAQRTARPVPTTAPALAVAP